MLPVLGAVRVRSGGILCNFSFISLFLGILKTLISMYSSGSAHITFAVVEQIELGSKSLQIEVFGSFERECAVDADKPDTLSFTAARSD